MSLCRLAIFNALYFTKRLCQQIWRFTFRFNKIKFMKVFIAVLLLVSFFQRSTPVKGNKEDIYWLIC